VILDGVSHATPTSINEWSKVMNEVETTIVRTTDGIPVRVEDTSSSWTLGFLVLAAIALVIGAIAMYNNNVSTSTRQQTMDMQQSSLQQQQSETQRLQDMTAAQQAMNQQVPNPVTTNVVITDGLNGAAGPGSKTISPPVLEVKVEAPAPAAPPAPATPPEPVGSTSPNP